LVSRHGKLRFGATRLGAAWRGLVGRGKDSNYVQGVVWRGEVRLGTIWRGGIRRGMAGKELYSRRGQAWLDLAVYVWARSGTVWQGPARQGEARITLFGVHYG